jgi:phosphoglucomutase
MEKAAKMMFDLRNDVPACVGGAEVTVVKDYQAGTATELRTGTKNPIGLPCSNVVELILGDRGIVIVRPSGTEPKIKFYFTAVGQTKAEAQALLDACVHQMTK